MEWLKGKRTVIVFVVVLLNGILVQLGWGLELPPEYEDKIGLLLSALALLLRYFSTTPVFKSR